MSAIKIVGKGNSEWMEPLLDGGYTLCSNENANQYACLDCGLVWSKKWEAEKCESRKHRPTYEAGPYGVTQVINGVPQGGKYYTRHSIRKIKI